MKKFERMPCASGDSDDVLLEIAIYLKMLCPPYHVPSRDNSQCPNCQLVHVICNRLRLRSEAFEEHMQNAITLIKKSYCLMCYGNKHREDCPVLKYMRLKG